MTERLSRQRFLGPRSETVLRTVVVGIVGLGGGGSHIAQQLAHLGIHNFILFDPDNIDESNLNRTVGATEADVADRREKVRIAERTIRGINPRASIEAVAAPWQTQFPSLRSCDFVFGCVDGVAGRRDLEESCRRALIPLLDIGMDVHPAEPFSISGQIAASVPGLPCLRCFGIVRDDRLAEEGQRYGSAGPRPQVVWPNGVLASTAVGMFIQLLTPWSTQVRADLLIGYDGDRLVLEADPRVAAIPGTCAHFPDHQVGDPLWPALPPGPATQPGNGDSNQEVNRVKRRKFQ